jgi:sulfate permease, SulP family
MSVLPPPSRNAERDSRAYPRAIVTGLIGGLIMLSGTLSIPAVIFTGALERYLGVGIGLGILSTTLTCAALALWSSYPAVLGRAHLAPAVGLGIVAASMSGRLGSDAPDAVVLGTLLLLIVLTSLSLGVVLLVLGWRRWGNIARFVPYPVVGGFLAYVAVLLLQNGLEIMLGQPLHLENAVLLLRADQLLRWVPGVLVAAGLLVLQKARPHYLNMPLVMVGAVGLFWLVAWLAAMPFAALQAAGYLLPPLGTAAGGAMWSPAFLLGTLAAADWSVALRELPTLVLLWLVSLITLLLAASTIEVATRADIDLDQELKAAGFANLLCGLGGALPGYHSINGSILSHVLGTRSRLVGLTSAVLCAASLLSAGPLLPYLPKLLLGFLLIYLGFGLVVSEVLGHWARMATAERGFLLLVLVCLLTFGFLAGLAIGMVAGLALFAFSYARLDLIHAAGNAARFRSNVFRPTTQLRMLEQRADAIQVVVLQGYLFFGSTHNLLERIEARLAGPDPQGGLAFLILDCERVGGMDSSALFALTRLLQRTGDRGCVLLFAAASPQIARALQRTGLVTADRPMFADLDHALEHAENGVLAIDRIAAPQSGLDELDAAYPEVEVRKQLTTYCERITWHAGEHALRQGAPSDAMYFVESGQLTVWRERPGNSPIRLRTIIPGTVIGELGFYRGAERSAMVIADQESTAFAITRQALRRMQEDNPGLAVIFHRFMATIAAERAADSVRLLEAGR